MTLYKGASVCNSNLNKEAILLAKGTRINLFPLPQHAPHHWSSRECWMLTIDRRLRDQPNQQEPHQGLTRKVGSQHFAEHIGGKQNREAIDAVFTQHNLHSQVWDNLPTAQSTEMRKQPISEQTPWEKSVPGYRKEHQQSQGWTSSFLLYWCEIVARPSIEFQLCHSPAVTLCKSLNLPEA